MDESQQPEWSLPPENGDMRNLLSLVGFWSDVLCKVSTPDADVKTNYPEFKSATQLRRWDSVHVYVGVRTKQRMSACAIL